MNKQRIAYASLSRILVKFAVIVGATVALSACSKLTQKNYDALEMGMSREEVTAILGSADDCSKTLGTESCIWGSEDGAYIKISFIADNAATFSNNGLK